MELPAEAGMDAKTAGKYLRDRRLPSEMKPKHLWPTRPDPFEQVRPDLRGRLLLEPGLQAKTLFEYLHRTLRDRFPGGRVRTLQRILGSKLFESARPWKHPWTPSGWPFLMNCQAEMRWPLDLPTVRRCYEESAGLTERETLSYERYLLGCGHTRECQDRQRQDSLAVCHWPGVGRARAPHLLRHVGV